MIYKIQFQYYFLFCYLQAIFHNFQQFLYLCHDLTPFLWSMTHQINTFSVHFKDLFSVSTVYFTVFNDDLSCIVQYYQSFWSFMLYHHYIFIVRSSCCSSDYWVIKVLHIVFITTQQVILTARIHLMHQLHQSVQNLLQCCIFQQVIFLNLLSFFHQFA
jgi:hypothetical protein